MILSKNIFKGPLVLFVISCVVGGGYYFYNYEEQYKVGEEDLVTSPDKVNELDEQDVLDEKELAYATKKKWEWYDKFERIQIHTDKKNNKSVLRKVYISESYVIYALKDQDYNLVTMASFVTTCKPKSEIEIPEKFPDGTAKKLVCNENGNALNYTVKWKNPVIFWEESLGGFSIKEESLFLWDFSKLDQEVTLSRTK